MKARPEVTSNRRAVRSRFQGVRAYLAPYYRALWPALPHDVDAMTPSQVAAVLGLDEADVVSAVPFEDRPPETPPVAVDPSVQPKLRMVL